MTPHTDSVVSEGTVEVSHHTPRQEGNVTKASASSSPEIAIL